MKQNSAEPEGEPTHPLKQAYPGIDLTLILLCEEPGEWFQGAIGHYPSAFGPVADICDLSPEHAVFHFCDRVRYYPGIDDVEVGEQISDHSETVYVQGEESAQDESQPAAWVVNDGSHFHYYERVPFEEPITSVDEMRDTLDEIMVETPDWDEVISEAQKVAQDIQPAVPASREGVKGNDA
jgi:hypothetical protein